MAAGTTQSNRARPCRSRQQWAAGGGCYRENRLVLDAATCVAGANPIIQAGWQRATDRAW